MKIKISVYSNVKICLSSKFGWNRPSNFVWDIENVKRLQTGRQTTNKMWSKNITWTFSSGQLKCHFQHKMTRKTKMKFLKPYCAYIGLQKSYSKKWFVYCWKCKRSSGKPCFYVKNVMIYIKIIIEVGRGIRNDMVYEGNFNELKRTL